MRTTILAGALLLPMSLAFVGNAAADETEQAQAEEQTVDDIVGEGVDIGDVDLDDLLSVPLVEAASRRIQSLFDAPSDVSVLTAADIEEEAAPNIALALRRIPGLLVLESNSNSFNVAARGVSRVPNNYALTLIDGRNVASASIGATQWGLMPFHPGDVEKIEVLRGPGTTLYGANGVSGVINITTKKPLDHIGIEGWATGGMWAVPGPALTGEEVTQIENGGSAYAAASVANEAKDLGARVSFGYTSPPDWEDYSGEAYNGDFGYYASLTGQWKRDDKLQVLASITHARNEEVTAQSATSAPFSSIGSEQAVNLRVQGKDLADGRVAVRGQVDGRRLVTAAGGTVDEPSSRVDTTQTSVHGLVLADVDLWDGKNLITVGGEVSGLDTEDFFERDITGSYLALILQDEWRILNDPKLLLNVGLRLERVESKSGGVDVVYKNANPRAAVVYNANDRWGLRASFSTAYRTPAQFENFISIPGNFAAGAGGVVGPESDVLVPNPRLKPTQVRSYELGYRSHLLDTLRFDTTLFFQELDDVADVSRELRLPLRFENVYSSYDVGVEVAAQYRPNEDVSSWLNYTHTHTWDQATGNTIVEHPEHILAVGASFKLPRKARIYTDFSYWSEIDASDQITLVDGLFGRQRVPVASQYIWDVVVGREVFENGELYLSAQNIAGVWRDVENLQQLQGGLVAPIGSSYLIGLRIKEGW